MKIAILSLLAISLMVVSCKEEEDTRPLKAWRYSVRYINDSVDTLETIGHTTPYMRVEHGVSIVVTDNWSKPIASYVKTIKILKEDEFSR